MNLKIEQRIIGETITENEPVIYSKGVFLRPLEVFINGNSHFIWVADSFNDDSFLDGKNISPNLISKSINELFSI